MKNIAYSLLTAAGLAAVLGTAPLAATAQTAAPVTQTDTQTVTATITAIDYTKRIVALQFADKSTQTASVDPSVQRFPQLKVGDQVSITETVSMAYSIVKPGATPPPDAATLSAAPGAKPGGSASASKTTIVTVTAIDASVPAVTILTADGRTLSMKVKDPKNLANLKVGDHVQVTYTESVVVNVK